MEIRPKRIRKVSNPKKDEKAGIYILAFQIILLFLLFRILSILCKQQLF